MNSKGQCSIESIYFNCPRSNKQGFTVHKKRDFSIKLKKSYDGLFFHSNISKKILILCGIIERNLCYKQ